VAVCQSRHWLEGLQSIPEVSRIAKDLFTKAERFANSLPEFRRQLRRQTRVVQAPAAHLAIRSFGHASVSVGGRLLSMSEWQTQSVREFFFFLLTISRPMTKEQIGEALWQGMYEPSKLKLRFKNEIYRLRKAVGQDAILYKDNHYSFNRSLDYEYDVEAFEAFIAKARTAETSLQQVELYQKAVALVNGVYLNDMYADWTIHDRERLRQMHLNALAALGNLYLTSAQFENALNVCRETIAQDPAFESAYQIMMQVYSRLNDLISIKRTYQACVDAMKESFGLPPSREVQELYHRLTQ
jgi:two-component SAPR family response regulator